MSSGSPTVAPKLGSSLLSCPITHWHHDGDSFDMAAFRQNIARARQLNGVLADLAGPLNKVR
jgi:hypothetical protein